MVAKKKQVHNQLVSKINYCLAIAIYDKKIIKIAPIISYHINNQLDNILYYQLLSKLYYHIKSIEQEDINENS